MYTHNTQAVCLEITSDRADVHDVKCYYRTKVDALRAVTKWLLQNHIGRLVWLDDSHALTPNAETVVELFYTNIPVRRR